MFVNIIIKDMLIVAIKHENEMTRDNSFHNDIEIICINNNKE